MGEEKKLISFYAPSNFCTRHFEKGGKSEKLGEGRESWKIHRGPAAHLLKGRKKPRGND